ncbi:uncharacterized protein LOC106512152 [Austrofundulus limnaeus]|uniref:Uncharacterized protein LOC106512152 n=1 Tax=Austrofundulus limnaeus TaxID=52670 RepID=A0A2I4ALA5_AUSLI|nr:PREDICTED: uncharacterized protein LOC106512152 [Austrofundulus limnaeus]
MTKLINYGSDELYDSSGSGEEYVPWCSDDSSLDTDESCVTETPSTHDDETSVALADLEKKLCQHFKRVEIKGKRGRKVPVLLTPGMQESLDLLVAKRQECEVPKDNIYLFGRPSAWSCYRGSDCLRHFAKVCGAKSPENITSTKLRKQTGTLSQILNLSNAELDQLADFLGHDIRVHRQFYRLPDNTIQLAKISKVLMALEQGRLSEFKGKNLDDIIIGPEENVPMDSDANEGSDEGDKDAETMESEDGKTVPDVNQDVELDETQDSAVTPSQSFQSPSSKKSKSRRQFKRKMWEKEEIAAVEKHMMSFITTCCVPRKSDCDKCLQKEKTALKNRNWLAIKFYIKNRITSLKNKV